MVQAFSEPYPELTISLLRADTPDPYCTEYPETLHTKFTAPHPRHPEYGAYQNGCSILILPATFDDYWASQAGHHTDHEVRRARKAGYRFEIIDRDHYLEDLFAINTSLDERQGRPMTEGYRRRLEPFGPLPRYGCPHHQLRTYGVLKDDHLVAYSWVLQVGQMCLFSQILGHGDHMRFGIMRLLVTEALRDLISVAGTRYAMYNMHASGTEGLRFFKERLGFRPYWVNWQLADEPVVRTAAGRVGAPGIGAPRGHLIRRIARRVRRSRPGALTERAVRRLRRIG